MDANEIANMMVRPINKAQNPQGEIILPEFRRTSDAEKFICGFKQLCEQCNMHQISYSSWRTLGHSIPIITSFRCDDGTSVSIVNLLNSCGFDIEFK